MDKSIENGTNQSFDLLFPMHANIVHVCFQVKPFGSYVSGLGTRDSDIDLVITGVLTLLLELRSILGDSIERAYGVCEKGFG